MDGRTLAQVTKAIVRRLKRGNKNPRSMAGIGGAIADIVYNCGYNADTPVAQKIFVQLRQIDARIAILIADQFRPHN